MPTPSYRLTKLSAFVFFISALSAKGQLFMFNNELIEPPTIIRHPSELPVWKESFWMHENVVYIAERVSFELPCSATGDPAPTYYWQHNGNAINQQYLDDISYESSAGPLQFREFRPEFDGTYQCFAVGGQLGPLEPLVAASERIYLSSVKFPAHAGNQPPATSTLQLQTDQYVMLQCGLNLADFAPPPNVDWTDELNRSVTLGNIHHKLDPEGNLHVLAVRRQLNGTTVKCVAQHAPSNLTFVRNAVTVRVADAPKPSEAATEPRLVYPQAHASTFAFVKTQEARISCIFAGNPLPAVTFHKDSPDNAQLNAQNAGTAVVKDGTLSWVHVSIENQGVYYCKGSNGNGNGKGKGNGKETSWRFEIRVVSPPGHFKPIEFHDRFHNALTRTKVTINCSTDADPPATVKWYKNNKIIDSQFLAQNPRFTISEDTQFCSIDGVTESDSCIMQCNASNQYGHDFSNIYVNISTSDGFFNPNGSDIIFTMKDGGNVNGSADSAKEPTLDGSYQWWLIFMVIGATVGGILIVALVLYIILCCATS